MAVPGFRLVLLIFAIAVFLLAAAGVPSSPRMNLQPLGLALLAMAMFIG